ncbi:MAG: hypothetical protein QW092_02240 [Candidatus Korarchaeum sp.]
MIGLHDVPQLRLMAGGRRSSNAPGLRCRIGWSPGETLREVEDQMLRRLEEASGEDN